MKRRTMLIWACLIMFFLVGCVSSCEKTTVKYECAPQELPAAQQVEESFVPTSIEPNARSETSAYSVFTQNYSELSISIDYPQISGLSDGAIEKVVNEKIKAMFLANFVNNWEWEGLSVEATYEVKRKDSHYFSVLCLSEPYVSETAHPSYFRFGITIDLRTGNLIPIEDVITLKQFRDCIDTRNYSIVPSSLTEVMSFDALADMPQYKSVVLSDIFNHCSFYLTEDSICYLTGISHAFGDVATIVFPWPEHKG